MLRAASASLARRAAAARARSAAAAANGGAIEQPEHLAAAIGVPAEHLKRKVYVYSPARTASQQGRALVGNWKIEFESAKKWDNPLMGWASSGDMASTTGQMALNFTSKDAALAFANKHGWEVELTEPKKMVTGRRAKAYADRFSFKRKGLPIDPRGQ